MNKVDLLAADEADSICVAIESRLQWSGPSFRVSAISGAGTDALAQAVMRHLELAAEEESEPH